MAKIIVNPTRCPQDHACPAIPMCPVDAITQQGFGLPKIDEAKCIMCKQCMTFCPMNAFKEITD